VPYNRPGQIDQLAAGVGEGVKVRTGKVTYSDNVPGAVDAVRLCPTGEERRRVDGLHAAVALQKRVEAIARVGTRSLVSDDLAGVVHPERKRDIGSKGEVRDFAVEQHRGPSPTA
jgi:hypothetical protein